jgi:hypothetical protein
LITLGQASVVHVLWCEQEEVRSSIAGCRGQNESFGAKVATLKVSGLALLNARKTFFFPLDRLSIKYIEFVNYYAMSLIGPRGGIAKW